jgi:hypothetical protein
MAEGRTPDVGWAKQGLERRTRATLSQRSSQIWIPGSFGSFLRIGRETAKQRASQFSVSPFHDHLPLRCSGRNNCGMSFDLHFCGPRGAQLDVHDLRRHMNGLEYVTEARSDDGSPIQFEYGHPATGVYCLFDVSTRVELENEEALVLPDPYVSMGMSVSINFLRPHFFALESMPIVSGVAASLGLSLYDPQDDRVHAPGTSSEVLIRSWIEHNDRPHGAWHERTSR